MYASASTAILQRFTSQRRICWLVSHGEYARFGNLGLDACPLPPSEAVLVLRDWSAEGAPWSPEVRGPRHRDVLADFSSAVADGRLRVYEERRFVALNSTAPPAVDLCSLAQEPALEPAVSHWVEVRLHDEHGEPRGGEPYRVVLGDGTELEGRLDTNGMARIPGLPPGPCRWSFPSLQPGEWARA